MSQTAHNNRFITIDFLRGIAALGVMFYHAFYVGIFAKHGEILSFPVLDSIYIYPVSFGFTGVYLFFVISGFCIHLRWVKANIKPDTNNPLNFFSFWKRRFRRIYPAYIAALLLFVLAQYYLGNLQFNSFFIWDFVSHILMLHNLDNRTVYSLNSVFWTLAIEEQLYMAYFLLIWLRTKYGWLVTILICFAARIIWFVTSFAFLKLMNYELPISESSLANWGVWALGAICVEAKYGLIKLPRWAYSSVLGTSLFLITAAIYIFAWTIDPKGIWYKICWVIMQPLWGISFFFLVNYFVEFENKFSKRQRKIVLAIAGVGVFSYSLYLTHELVFLFVPNVAPIIKSLLSLGFAWLFYLLFEKPFMNLWNREKENKTAVIDPGIYGNRISD